MKRTISAFTGVLLILQWACNNTETTKPVVEAKIKVENEGVHIDYDDSKTGDTTLLFIHGWGINRSYWASQVSYFSPSYRVVTVDLPGFGLSGRNRKNWSIENYAADIAVLMQALDLRQVILIGHSMSGAIIVQTALNNPQRVIAIVGVDNFKNVGFPLTPQAKSAIEKWYKEVRTRYTDFVTGDMAKELFAASTDTLVRQRVVNDIVRVDSVMSIDILEQADTFPLDTKLAALKKHLYLINSSYMPTDTAALRKQNINYTLYDVGPAGHYPMIEKPQAFNQLLEKIVHSIHQ